MSEALTDDAIEARLEARLRLEERGSDEIERLARTILDYTQADIGHARAAVRLLLQAMREPSETKFADKATGDLVDLKAPCGYCGGHGFALRAVIDHLLAAPTAP